MFYKDFISSIEITGQGVLDGQERGKAMCIASLPLPRPIDLATDCHQLE
ncbi:hypothetical protein C4K40_3730 [Pseudomonas sp. CMR5c]|nr:hypothetical protein C4K40_3730 [Pseudomonas sp. CMR5c]